MIEAVLATVLPVLITVAIGYAWTLAGHQLQSRDLTSLIADVATPCLIVSTFDKTRVSLEAVLALAGAAATAIIGFALVLPVLLAWLLGHA